MSEEAFDVVVVGGGNAGLCAAIAAREEGATVLVLERAPPAERGGNSAFTAGSIRLAYEGVHDLRHLMPDLTSDELGRSEFGSYSEASFFDDVARLGGYRADADLLDVVVRESQGAWSWVRTKGVRFLPQYGRQAYDVDGKFKFWGGLTVETAGGGVGLVDALYEYAAHLGIPVRYSTRGTELLYDGTAVRGVRVRTDSQTTIAKGGAVVLACGGFQANPAWRAQYLGPQWDLARVRGTRFDTGDGIRMALDIGAAPRGNWSGCHAVAWDYNAPESGDLVVRDGFQKHSFCFGITLNADGKRFIDEGADFWNFTYAIYGHEILKQPNQLAWQVFDAEVQHLLRDEYRIPQVTRVEADSVDELVVKLEGIDSQAAVETIRAFNGAVRNGRPFDPNARDGRRTEGLGVPKSNWALRVEKPPFVAYGVTCGITFTYGGLHVTPDAEVVDGDGRAIPRLFAAGELVGGLFYANCPAGVGLTAGAVLGRRAGRNAASSARDSDTDG